MARDKANTKEAIIPERAEGTTTPIFTPKQCQMIIEAGRKEPKLNAQVGNKIPNEEELFYIIFSKTFFYDVNMIL